MGGVGDGLVCTGSTGGVVANRYALESRRNQLAIGAVAHLNLIESVCRLGIVGDCAAARSRRLAVAAENRHNAVNARLARCPFVGDLGVFGGLADRIARHAAGGRVRDLERDRAVGGSGRIVCAVYRCGQRDFIARYLRLAAGSLDRRRFGCAGLEQLAASLLLVQTGYQRQTGVGVSILRVVGAVPLVDGEFGCTFTCRRKLQNRKVAIGLINGRQAVFAVGIGALIADGVRCCHWNGRFAILAIIFTICTKIQRQRIRCSCHSGNTDCGVNLIFLPVVERFSLWCSLETAAADFIRRSVQCYTIRCDGQLCGRIRNRAGVHAVSTRCCRIQRRLHLIIVIAGAVRSAIYVGQRIVAGIRIIILLVRLGRAIRRDIILCGNGFRCAFCCCFVGCIAAGTAGFQLSCAVRLADRQFDHIRVNHRRLFRAKIGLRNDAAVLRTVHILCGVFDGQLIAGLV